jgi:TetR/AcrR family transcriptional repressor of nem operon
VTPRGALRIEPADIQRVLDTAAQLFATHGFDSVGIRDIARESGVTMPSIYYHFTSKEALYDEATAHQYEMAMDRVGKAINTQRLPAGRIESFVSEVFDLFLADRTFFLLVQRDVADSAASRIPLRFMRSYDIVINESQRMLTVALGREVETRDAFAVISLILGFCELTVIAAKSGDAREEWYREQKRYLTTIVNRVLTH